MRSFLLVLGIVLGLSCTSEHELIPDDEDYHVFIPPNSENKQATDEWVLRSSVESEILFVVDNSCSMHEEQARLAYNFPIFMQYILGTNLDYHIGVVSTDMVSPYHSGRLQGAGGHTFIDPSVQQPISLFSQMTSLGTSGSANERSRDPVFWLIQGKQDIEVHNAGFYRPEADSLHLVFITDSNDQSVDISMGEFQQWLSTLKGPEQTLKAHAIAAFPWEDCSDIESYGTSYGSYVSWTGGSYVSICDENWSGFFSELGLQVAGDKKEFFLSKNPVVDTIDVRNEIVSHEGNLVTLLFDTCHAGEEAEEETCDVVYNPGRNSISFLEHNPPKNSRVTVTFDIRGHVYPG